MTKLTTRDILDRFDSRIVDSLKRDDLTDLFINEDKIFIKTHGSQESIGDVVGSLRFVINEIAYHNDTIINEANPILETVFAGYRITATIPPVTTKPTMSIRKPNHSIIPLTAYVERNQLSQAHYDYLVNAILERKNILVIGGTGSGKTTLTNALIDALATHSRDNQRIVILEDIDELVCAMPNKVKFLTSTNVNMTRLLKLAMRSNPERILVGEVRDATALDMLKAWNTGSPGGIATIHANGCEEGLQRVIDLSMEAGIPAPYSLVEHTINVCVFVSSERTETGYHRAVRAVAEVIGFDRQSQKFKLKNI